MILDGFTKAFSLILHLDADLLGIIFLSLKISFLALVIAVMFGIPLGAFIGLKRLPAKGAIIILMNTLAFGHGFTLMDMNKDKSTANRDADIRR